MQFNFRINSPSQRKEIGKEQIKLLKKAILKIEEPLKDALAFFDIINDVEGWYNLSLPKDSRSIADFIYKINNSFHETAISVGRLKREWEHEFDSSIYYEKHEEEILKSQKDKEIANVFKISEEIEQCQFESRKGDKNDK